MSPNDVIQGAIVGMVLALSTGYLLGRWMPELATELRRGFGVLLDRSPMPPPLRRLGRRWRLSMPVAKVAGCGSGCGSCKGCGTVRPADTGRRGAESPLKFAPARKPRS